jgi:3-dehydroquinate synthase
MKTTTGNQTAPAAKPLNRPAPTTTRCPDHVTPICQWGNYGFKIADGGNDYDVIKCQNLFNKFNPTLAKRIGLSRVYMVIDPKVYGYWEKQISEYFSHYQISTFKIVLTKMVISESMKDEVIYGEVMKQLWSFGATTEDKLLLIGGGTVMDLGGFVACTYRGGMPFIAIPTTLLAMVDAAPSPKCAVNVCGIKNLARRTYYPEVVLYDTAFLGTLNSKEFQEGLAEIVKVAIVGSESLCNRLFSQPLNALKNEICGLNSSSLVDEAILLFLELKWVGPYPNNNPASIRSYGHHFSRWLETTSRFILRHGQAVSVEMVVATHLAGNLGILSSKDRAKILGLLSHLGLSQTSVYCDADIIWRNVFAEDVARNKKLYFPVPSRVGEGTFVNSFTLGDLRKAIADASQCDQILSFAE